MSHSILNTRHFYESPSQYTELELLFEDDESLDFEFNGIKTNHKPGCHCKSCKTKKINPCQNLDPEFETLFDDDGLYTTELNDEQFLGSVWPFSSSANIIDRTAYSPKDKRKKVRNIKDVYALVLHQTGFSRGNEPKKYNKVTSHFVILPNGTILQLHPLTAYLYASNGFNRGSVAVEFVGNFPSTQGKCYKPERFGCNKVSNEQIQAGRKLIKYLSNKINLTHILAHRQSSGSRGNDPGPDLWFYVGQWAVNNRGLNDGGSDFKIQSGKSIPDAWRNWK